MNAVLNHANSAAVDHHLDAFVAAMPRIVKTAHFHFRRIPCLDSREDYVCETVALCWVWYVRLVGKGRDPAAFMTALARYGVTAVHSGRRLCGQEKAKDVLSRRCQCRRGIRVTSLPHEGTLEDSTIGEALRDNTRTPVFDQVQFRCDFPAWMLRLPARKRQLVDMLALGHWTKDLAVEFGLSESRISQLKKEFHADYTLFCGTAAGD